LGWEQKIGRRNQDPCSHEHTRDSFGGSRLPNIITKIKRKPLNENIWPDGVVVSLITPTKQNNSVYSQKVQGLSRLLNIVFKLVRRRSRDRASLWSHFFLLIIFREHPLLTLSEHVTIINARLLCALTR